MPITSPLSLDHERGRRHQRALEISMRYASGDETVEDIAADYGCAKGTILRHARMAGLPKRPKCFPAEIRAGVIEDYKNGIPIAEIAGTYSVSPAYVSRVATDEGINRYGKRPSCGPDADGAVA